MADPLHECIRNFGRAPRELSLWDRLTYLRVPKPAWLRAEPDDKLNALFQNLPTLFANGTVVWGHIIQANRMMFEAGPINCPGEFVYSLEDARIANPQNLQKVAHELYSLKGTEPDDVELQ